VNRREFLSNSFTTGLSLLAAGTLLQSCNGNLRSKLFNEPPATFRNKLLSKTGYAILHYASLAPSGHNTQPWSVKVLAENEWVLAVDPLRRLPAVDPTNRELFLALGAFIENLSLAAGVRGYAIRVDLLAQTTQDEEVAKITLHKATPRDYSLNRLVLRRTVKSGLLPKELKDADLRVLTEPLKDRLFYFPRSTSHAKCIADGIVESYRVQTDRDRAQKELAQWIRLGEKQARKHRDGLTAQGMDITGPAGWYVDHFMNQADVMTPLFRKKAIEKTIKQTREGAGWLIITSPGNTVADLIETGRRFEQMALLARERRIAIHPMTQLLEEESGQQVVNTNHGPKIMPQFVLRVGYVEKYPDPVSLRRPVDWFLKS